MKNILAPIMCIMVIFLSSCSIDLESPLDKCNRYASTIIENSYLDKNGTLCSKSDSIINIYKDSLNMSFNELSTEQQIVFWDTYLNADTIHKMSITSSLDNIEFKEKILSTIPDAYDEYTLKTCWIKTFKEMLSKHHFNPDDMDYNNVTIHRTRAYESVYNVTADVNYINLFNATVHNKISCKILVIPDLNSDKLSMSIIEYKIK